MFSFAIPALFQRGVQSTPSCTRLVKMLSLLLNVLLATNAQATIQMPLADGGKPPILPANQANLQFELKSSPDVFSPKDMLSMPRPGQGLANPDGDLVIVPVSQYSFETKKWVFPKVGVAISSIDTKCTPSIYPPERTRPSTSRLSTQQSAPSSSPSLTEAMHSGSTLEL